MKARRVAPLQTPPARPRARPPARAPARAQGRAAAPGDEPAPSDSHRERLIAAMAASIEARGYRSTSVADVVAIARTSRRTFYEHFEDRDACFLALFEATTAQTMAAIAHAVTFEGEWEQQVDAAVGAYLDSVAARPALFASFFHELPALGGAGIDRARGVSERFVDLLVGLVEAGRRERPDLDASALPRDTAVIVVGGLRDLMLTALEQGRDVREVRAGASDAVKAIMRAAVLHVNATPATER
jgi:AcrR family transcriptional regulator